MKNRIVEFCRSRSAGTFIRRGVAFATVALVFSVVMGCGTAERRPELSEQERETQERLLGDRWAREIGALLVTREDPVVEDKMAALSARLGQPVRPVVTFYSGRSGRRAPPIFVLPGNRWYFASAALKSVRYDNELAAAVAAALALGERTQEGSQEGLVPRVSDPVAPLSVPEYTEADWRRVNGRMVDLLYQAGFDPRGVPNFWRKAAPSWPGMSPDWGVLLQEEAHVQISRRMPLLNPVVRTPEFGEIEKRLKQL